jgi:hypothetical protein
MDQEIVERRRLLRWIALGSLAVPAVALAGCASGGARQPNFRTGGGNRGGEKGGGRGGGPGGAGSK